MSSHAPDPSPPSVSNCHTFSDPLPLERDVLYGRPLIRVALILYHWNKGWNKAWNWEHWSIGLRINIRHAGSGKVCLLRSASLCFTLPLFASLCLSLLLSASLWFALPLFASLCLSLLLSASLCFSLALFASPCVSLLRSASASLCPSLLLSALKTVMFDRGWTGSASKLYKTTVIIILIIIITTFIIWGDKPVSFHDLGLSPLSHAYRCVFGLVN